MTVIVTDGRTMAGDGRITRTSHILTDEFVKVVRLKDGTVLGGCGDVPSIMLARQWLEDGHPFGNIPKLNKNFEAIRLFPDGHIEWFDKGCVFVPYFPPFAIGSGSQYALSALLLGATPKRAVAFAAKLNAHVGGRITTLRPTLPKRTP